MDPRSNTKEALYIVQLHIYEVTHLGTLPDNLI